MKILITGATGFVGKTLIPYLLYHSYTEVCLLVRDKEKAQELFPTLNVKVISTNNDDWTAQVINYQPDIVLHLATYFTGKHDNDSIQQLISSNILFTTLLLEAVSHTHCKHFVNIGTFTEFINGTGEYLPNNLYSATKTSVRSIIRYYQMLSEWNWINVIIYSPYGRQNSSKKVIDYLIDAVNSPTPVNFSPGEQILDFIHVDDIANFFVTLLNRMNQLTEPYYQFHLGTGTGHTIKEVAKVIEKVFGKAVNANWGGRDYTPLDPMYAVAPINKNIDILAWKSHITLEEGISILYKEITTKNE